MSDRPGNPDPEQGLRRRRFLRKSAILTLIGSLSGCLDEANGPSDAIDWLPEEGRPDDETPDADDEPPDANDEPADAPIDERVERYELAIHERVNEIRRDQDRDELVYNEEIAAIARHHSADMAEREYVAHESPEGEGPEDRMDDFFPQYCRGIGENIASVRYPTGEDPDAVAERVVTGWMESPGHRENVLREMFDEQGIGVVITDDDRVLATQKFCSTTGIVG